LLWVNLLKPEQLGKKSPLVLLESACQVNGGELVDSFRRIAEHRGTRFQSSEVVLVKFLPWFVVVSRLGGVAW
jgi:hypothetical protein